MRAVAVAGAAVTRFGRFPDATLKGLTRQAVTAATADARIGLERVEAAAAANAIAGLITGQEMVRGQVALRPLGLSGIPVVNVENACAGGGSALHLAWLWVASGMHDVVLAVGAEKMTHSDRRRAVRAIATALDVEEPVDPAAVSPFMSVYAERVRRYLKDTGADVADFARVVVKAQRNGARNPKAQYGSETLTVGDVLDAPMVAEPLTRLMCSPIGDGAAAVVLAAGEVVPRLGVTDPVWVRASVLRSAADPGQGRGAGALAAEAAYQAAGVGPDDLDVVELHDATAPAEVLRYEMLGLAGHGEGAGLVRDGVTELGGRLPVNPSGGLLARGHPIGATGLAQAVEVTDQLRGRCGARQVPGARVGLTENGGGFVGGDTAAECVHVFTR